MGGQPPLFTHLHSHTEYSMLDGISRIPDLVYQVRDMGMESLAITDHGNLYGVVDFYSECKEAGIKPIIGCEVLCSPPQPPRPQRRERRPLHLVLSGPGQYRLPEPDAVGYPRPRGGVSLPASS